MLLSREVDHLAKKLKELESAVTHALEANDDLPVLSILAAYPALTNFISDDVHRWTSPIGTWRMRLLQDAGRDMVGGEGLAILNDAELFIAPAGKAAGFDDPAKLSSGTFTGVLSIWMPAFDALMTSPTLSDHENLSNFAMRFDWDERERSLMNGELRGERRDGADGSSRVDYTATFEGQMSGGNRVQGYWFNDEHEMAGRFEMIRGTADFQI